MSPKVTAEERTGKRAVEVFFPSVCGQAEREQHGRLLTFGINTGSYTATMGEICGLNSDYSKQSLTFTQSNFFLPCWQTNWKCD